MVHVGYNQPISKLDIIYRLVQENKITLEEFLVLVQDGDNQKQQDYAPIEWPQYFPSFNPKQPYLYTTGGSGSKINSTN